jgi:ethanolamine utilization microcompartment shell protein EutS
VSERNPLVGELSGERENSRNDLANLFASPRPKSDITRTLLIVLALVLAPGTAAADTLTIGLFAPTAPFPSTSARVELASKLGDQIGKAFGQPGTGKVFARAGDFSAAVKKGEVTVALVDATFLAATGGSFTVVAAGVRNGDTTHGWQLVARSADKIAALKGKRVLVPNVGGREADFVLNVLLGGEVGRDFFAKIEAAPDTASALTALGLGKTDAAIVPAGVELPSGTASILSLPVLSGPVLVVFGSLAADRKTALNEAINSFKGDSTIASLRVVDGDAVRQIVRRFSPSTKRGPLAIPAIRLLVGDLVEGRTFAIERTPATVFAAAPDRR